jgi:hypothetical protein
MAPLVLLLSLAMVASVAASPLPNGATLATRIFNDCPTSVLSTTNSYPALIEIDDQNLSCGGFANLHNWSFSEDGGATPAVFNNGDSFTFGADLEVSGTGGEAGLRLSPWWSQDIDGRFNVRSTDGQVACFGGRLPFYSFGNLYAGGVISLEIEYDASLLSPSNPGVITYTVVYGGSTYSSGPLPFDQGNLAEAPVYGTYGILNQARVGGYVQGFLQGGNPAAGVTATWSNISYQDMGTIAIEASSFGRLKSLYEK